MMLPMDLFRLIVEFLPLPRLWYRSLGALKRRSKLAPMQAALDVCLLFDEMLSDAGIFRGKNQSQLLVKLHSATEVRDCCCC